MISRMKSFIKGQVSMAQSLKKGFTLLELLIVISIIAILSVALVMVLNPAEILKKSRDSQRIADLNTIKTALGVYVTSTTTPFSATICPVSTSTSATGAASTTVNGTGWIPVNLTTLTGGSPISNLPLDPLNDAAHYYWFKCENTNNTFEVSTVLESQAYTVDDNKGAKDGGDDAARYEVGTKLNQ